MGIRHSRLDARNRTEVQPTYVQVVEDEEGSFNLRSVEDEESGIGLDPNPHTSTDLDREKPQLSTFQAEASPHTAQEQLELGWGPPPTYTEIAGDNVGIVECSSVVTAMTECLSEEHCDYTSPACPAEPENDL